MCPFIEYRRFFIVAGMGGNRVQGGGSGGRGTAHLCPRANLGASKNFQAANFRKFPAYALYSSVSKTLTETLYTLF